MVCSTIGSRRFQKRLESESEMRAHFHLSTDTTTTTRTTTEAKQKLLDKINQLSAADIVNNDVKGGRFVSAPCHHYGGYCQ